MNLLAFAVAGMVAGKGPGALVEIAIVLDADTGKPKAEPDSARVDAGGTIVWHSSEAFSIVPQLLWEEDAQKVSRSAKKTGDVYVLETTAGSVEGKYPYGISVNGQMVDPDVVIGPRNQ